MDTNQETGVSLSDIADLIEEPQEENQLPEVEASGDEELAAEVQQADESEEGEGEEGSLVEVEFNGKKYQVPEELKEGLMLKADYTQKTQVVAEQRRANEERASLLEARERVMGATFDKAVAVREIQNRLAQYEAIDWQTLAANDPAQATQLNIAYQQLQREAQAKNAELQQAHAQTQQLNQAIDQQKLEQERVELKSRIPNFSEKDSQRILKNIDAYGLTEQEKHLAMHSAKFVQILHEAAIGREFLASGKPKAMQKVAEAPRAIKPAAAQPKPRNQAALDRLKKNGRVEDLAALL